MNRSARLQRNRNRKLTEKDRERERERELPLNRRRVITRVQSEFNDATFLLVGVAI